MKKHMTTSIMSRPAIALGAILATGLFLSTISAASAQPTIQFAASSYTVSEAAASVTLSVQRLNDPTAEVHVDYAPVTGRPRLDQSTRRSPGLWPSALAKPTRPLWCRS
jgi:hypothetical protein